MLNRKHKKALFELTFQIILWIILAGFLFFFVGYKLWKWMNG